MEPRIEKTWTITICGVSSEMAMKNGVPRGISLFLNKVKQLISKGAKNPGCTFFLAEPWTRPHIMLLKPV
ncbi:MAG: hypothetical protein LLG37_01410 [Spirochaetia bacterium]|nr:hypothetical protein [Spirochaetia bacterium]